MDGVVTRLNAEVGEMVIYGTMNNPGTVICEVADLSKMLLVAQVDEADIGKLEVGQKAKVYVQAYGEEEFAGTVDTIALMHSMGLGGTKYFRTEIMLEPSEKQLFSGLTAHVDIETRRHKDAIKVPTQAVLGRPTDDIPPDIRDNNPLVNKDKAFATVVYRFIDGKAVVTPVRIGAMDMTHTIVLEGLSQGEKIITGPYKVLESLKHDQLVKDEGAGKDKKDDKTGAADANDSNDGQ
jgi:HlyD family secretion protein